MIINFIKEMVQKYKEIILYIIFGIFTVIVNTVAYDFLFSSLRLPNTPSTALAWLIAVIFAYITNKIFVFDSKCKTFSENIKECVSFFGCRLGTGILDIAIMYFAVDYFNQNAILWKIVSNVIVTVINYVVSKLLVFSKK